MFVVALRAVRSRVAASTLGLLGTGIFAVSMFAPTEKRVASGWIESGNYRLLGEQALAVSMALTLPVVVTLFLVGVAIRIGSLRSGGEEKPG